jgi:DNA modification methylase
MIDLRLGDCLEVMPTIPSGSVDAVVTDPPAGIKFMGKEWDTPGALVERKPDRSVKWDQVAGNHNPSNDIDRARTRRVERGRFIDYLTPRFAECFRVAKPGARALIWALPRTSHWTATAIEDAGWIIEDRVSHIFGQGFPKAKSKLKPAVEDWWKARKPLTLDQSTDTIIQSASLLENLLWLISPASLAADLFPSIKPELAVPVSVRWLAATMYAAESRDESGLMGMFSSQEEGSTYWSIVSLWSGISAASSGVTSTSTTATAISLTTALRTLNCLLSGIIPESIIRAASNPSGLTLPVSHAARLYADARESWNSTHARSAIGPVMRGVLNILASVAESLSLATATSPAGIVRVSATTGDSSAVEDWWLARKPGRGVPELNIDACRISTAERDDYGRSTTRADGTLSLARSPGYGLGDKPYTPSSAGRWPANLTLSHVGGPDGCREVGTRRVKSSGDRGSSTRSHAGLMNGTSEPRPTEGTGYADADGLETVAAWECVEGCPVAELDRQSLERGMHSAGSQQGPQSKWDPDKVPGWGNIGTGPCGARIGDSGGASRFFYCSKASRADRGEDNRHPTVKNTDLMRWLCRLITPPGGLILDPFMGSGSTLIAAEAEGFSAIGIDSDPESVATARRRWANKLAETPLFSQDLTPCESV